MHVYTQTYTHMQSSHLNMHRSNFTPPPTKKKTEKQNKNKKIKLQIQHSNAKHNLPSVRQNYFLYGNSQGFIQCSNKSWVISCKEQENTEHTSQTKFPQTIQDLWKSQLRYLT